MRKKIAAAAMGAALLAGGGAGALLMAPTIATAADSSSATSTQTASAAARPAAQRGKWVTDALKKLVDAGTINQSQADAVARALEAARPAGDGMSGRRGPGPGLATVATALGISESDLGTALRSGKTIADVAKANGVDVAKVVRVIADEMNSHLADAVTAGHLTQAQADEMKTHTTERATALVNGERPERGGPGGPGGFGGPPPGAPGSGASGSSPGGPST